MEVTEFVLSLGSNLGERTQNIQNAITLLSKEFGEPLKVSSFYESEPWGFASKNAFVNCCVKFTSNFSCQKVLNITQKIEQKLGRKKKTSNEYESREIDVDIVYFGREIIESLDLTIPHALFQDRNFVLLPLEEVSPNWVDPRSGLTIQQLIDNSSDHSKLTIL